MITRSEQGMTLMEIMIVVMIVALLALMAFPAMRKAREATQNTRFVSDMRVAVNAFEQRAFDPPGGFPPDAAPGVVPLDMDTYLSRMNWAGATPVDGQWDWIPGIAGFGNAVAVILGSAQDSRMQDIDSRIDDGDLTTGMFRKLGGTTYGYLVQ